ncbi:glycosyl hydrolase family 65 protein [Ideonella sp. DXS29W]|uniref:Glycosyl hydrolase family 65 protein n=1 Tax=Ideonella lacteola TaxID=2984193 RepID=A0ABU9BNN4_9BURK
MIHRACLSRARLVHVCLAAVAAAATSAHAAQPQLQFANPKSELLFGRAYQRALENVFTINQKPALPQDLDSGLLTGSPPMRIRAGGGYPDVWTRDASVNSWNAISLMEPELASNTLWAVVDRRPDGQLIVQQDGQWWDQVIWISAAWNHYLLRGDEGFLAHAYQAAVNTMAARRAANYDSRLGLFKGPSFFNDGISAYPSPPADDNESRGVGAGDYPATSEEMVLSTNAVYYSAYRSLAAMARATGAPQADIDGYDAMADSLKKNINDRLWQPHRSSYGFLLHQGDGLDGIVDDHQEGTGVSFAVIFGIANAKRAAQVVSHTTVDPWGIVDVSPDLPRYSPQKPGRHNAIVWPVVQGYWADAAARVKRQDLFAKEVARLAKLGSNHSGFFEIYNRHTGIVDGGWQGGFHWGSERDQTWSASAYLRMFFTNVFGLRPDTKGLAFDPILPVGWGNITATNVRYRQANLTIKLSGAGQTIASFKLDGVAHEARLPTSLQGNHTVEIQLKGGVDGDRDDDGVVDSADDCADEAGASDVNGCPSPSLLEAEDAFNSNGPMVANEHAGYSGRGFVEGPRVPGASMDFTIHRRNAPAKRYAVSVRYANGYGDARTLSLYVGGAKVGQLRFSPTGGWNQWADLPAGTFEVSGKTSHLVLRWDDGDNGLMNVDSVSLRPAP